MYKIGDKVEVTKEDHTYSRYEAMFKVLNGDLRKWYSGKPPIKGNVYTVLGICTQKETYVLIGDDTSQFVIGSKGIKLYKEKDMTINYKYESKAALRCAMLFLKDMGYKLSSMNYSVDKNMEDVYNKWRYLIIETCSKTTNACNIVSEKEVVVSSINELIDKLIPNPYKNEYIQAMKETAIEYIKEEHVQSYAKCKLCAVTAEVKGIPIEKFVASKENCSTCPWIVIQNKLCSCSNNDLNRAKELLDWVKYYEDM